MSMRYDVRINALLCLEASLGFSVIEAVSVGISCFKYLKGFNGFIMAPFILK